MTVVFLRCWNHLLRWVLTFLLITSISPLQAQRQAASQEEKIRDMIGFLERLLNTLGSGTASVADKEVIITESYTRIFRDSAVQVQDDLDENRIVITNKNIGAYLKDIDFFFEDARFEFNIEKIEVAKTINDLTYYRVTATRNLTGVTIDGKKVNNTIPRFIEINFDAAARDLKIVSIYTQEYDESTALRSWWDQLSLEWKRIFTGRLDLTDSVTVNDLKDITAIQHLDVSGNEYIQSLEPLSRLVELKLLNLSKTSIADLTPIRNLTGLVELDLSDTPVDDLSPLKYATSLVRLNISRTMVSDISVLEKMTELRNLQVAGIPLKDFSGLAKTAGLTYLDLQGTSVTDIAFLNGLPDLIELNISRTPVTAFHPIAALKRLSTLRADSTAIASLAPLKQCDSLQVLYANHTRVSSLDPLRTLSKLERIYCDQSKVSREEANKFMTARPGVLVVYDSKDLKSWWDRLSIEWRSSLGESSGISLNPTKEELVALTHIDSVNLRNQAGITDLEPLRRLHRLKAVVAANTSIENLSPLENHLSIRYLDITNTAVRDLSTLRKLTDLRILRADNTPLESIEPVYNLPKLETLYVDQCNVNDIVVRELLERNPGCLVIYKTSRLKHWWKRVPPPWITVFHHLMRDTSATRENLHRLVERENLQFSDIPVRDLSVLTEFVRLKRLHFSGTGIRSIDPVQSLETLVSLHATDGPVTDIRGVASMPQLLTLHLSNTAVDDLGPVSKLEKLERLNISGTQVKKLDPLKDMANLRNLNCSNSKVRRLKPVRYLALETLRCFNTSISRKEVQLFEQLNPNCRIMYFR